MTPTEENTRKSRLRWVGHVQSRPANTHVNRCETMHVMHVKYGREQPKKTWRETIKKMIYITIEEHVFIAKTW